MLTGLVGMLGAGSPDCPRDCVAQARDPYGCCLAVAPASAGTPESPTASRSRRGFKGGKTKREHKTKVSPKVTPPPGMKHLEGGEKDGRTVKPFFIDYTEVSVADFAAYVAARKLQAAKANDGGAEFKLIEELERSLETTTISERPLKPQYDEHCNWRGRAIRSANGALGGGGKDNHPINCISIDEAQKFCRFYGKRLPTLLEWQWAALQAGNPPKGSINRAKSREEAENTANGETVQVTQVLSYDQGDAKVQPVQDTLYHMFGNVAEFTHCEEGPLSCSSSGGGYRSFAGWQFDIGTPNTGAKRTDRSDTVGFRCAK